MPPFRPPLATMLAVVASWWSALLLERTLRLSLAIVILAVALAVTLSRSQAGSSLGGRLRALVLIPVVSVAAAGVGQLLLDAPLVGDSLFCLVLGAAIWVRRFGPLAARLGTLVSLPFAALMIAPIPPGAGRPATLWAAVVGVIAFAWVTVFQLALRVPAPASAFVTARGPGRPARGTRRLPASTRMALQLMLALAAAFVLGRALLPGHWPWVVLSAFVVSAGNRGRGDVVHKAILRLAGAGAGVVAATVLTHFVTPGSSVTVVAIFVVLGLAVWLREASYALWALGVTMIVALLYGSFGSSGAELLPERLGGVALGAALAVAAAWWVVPVRTRDVLRLRVAAVERAHPDERAAALAGVEQIAPALELERRLLRLLRRPGPYRADGIDELRRTGAWISGPQRDADGA